MNASIPNSMVVFSDDDRRYECAREGWAQHREGGVALLASVLGLDWWIASEQLVVEEAVKAGFGDKELKE